MNRLRLCLLFLTFVLAAPAAEPQIPAAAAARAKLEALSHDLRKEVVRVTDGVWVAVGYGASNAILLEGTDGVVIVDTMESEAAAAPVKAAFDTLTTKPVKAIVYTHGHNDHVSGVKVFAGADNPEIWAHERLLKKHQPVQVNRGNRFGGNQFALGLTEEECPNLGIGPRLVMGNRATLEPTKTFAGDSHTLEIAGLKLELYYAPGETDDQIFIWLPEKRTLLPGDNFYRAFPNLYAIRGTHLRRADQWLASLEAMQAKGAEFLVPSHTRPVLGASEVARALADYHGGIRSVLDQTLAGMNRGLTPDELAAEVKLPPALAASPYLGEHYGTVAFAVRAIYTFYLGWFDGNPTHLNPLPARERATRLIPLLGGEKPLLEAGEQALAVGDAQWAAELADLLLAMQENHAGARELKARALSALGEAETGTNARSYYLTAAKALRTKPP